MSKKDRENIELLTRIEDLERENASLKSILSGVDESSGISSEKIINKHKTLLHISDYSKNLTSINPEEDIYIAIARQMKEISNCLGVTVSSFDKETGSLYLRAIAFGANEKNQIEKLLGRRLEGMKFKVDQAFFERLEFHPYYETDSLYDISFGEIPKPICKIVETIFGIDWILALGLIYNNELIGAMLLYGRKSDIRYSPQDLLGFQSVSSIALHRWLDERRRILSDKKYEMIANQSADIIWMMSMDLKFQYISKAIERITGFSPEEAMQMTFEQTLTPDSQKLVKERLFEEMEYEKNGNFDPNRFVTLEVEEYKKDGTTVWVEVSVSFVRDEINQPLAILGVSRDITEKKKSQKEIAFKTSVIESLLLNLPFDFWIRDKEQKLLLVNKNSKVMWGYDIGSIPDEAQNASDDVKEIWNNNNKRVLSGEVIKEETLLDGRNIYQIITPISDDEGIVGFGGINIDITELKQSERKISLRSDIIENSQNGIDIVDGNGKFVYANRAYLDMWGYESSEEIIGTSPSSHCKDHQMPYLIINTVNELGKARFEFEAVRKDGSTFMVLMDVFKHPDEKGEPIYIGSSIDISEKAEYIDLIEQSEEDLSITLHSIGDGVISTDPNGFVTKMNPVAELMTGWKLSEAKGMHLKDIFKIINAETRFQVENPVDIVLERGYVVGLANSTILISKDGTERQIADSAAPIKDKNGNLRGVVLVFSDVTEDYQIRKDLRQSRLRLEKAELQAGFGNWELDLNNKSMLLSKGSMELLGVWKNPITIEDYLEMLLPNFADEFMEIVANPKKINDLGTWEHRLRRFDNSEYRYLTTSFELDSKSNVLFGVMHDITSMKKAEEALYVSEARYRMIVENLSLAIIVHQNNKIVFANKSAYSLIGATKVEELIGANVLAYVHPDDRPMVLQAIQTAVYTNYTDFSNPSNTIEERIVRLDGTVINVEASAIIVDYQNEPALMVWLNDITVRKQVESLIVKSEAKFRSLAEHTLDIIVRYDSDFKISYINRSGLLLYGKTEKEIIGKHHSDFITNEVSKGLLWDMQIANVFSEGKSIRLQMDYEVNGSIVYLDWHLTPEYDENDIVLSVMGIARDITELRLITLELEKAKQKAEESDRLKSAFLANMSHEIRTPMNGIIGFSELLTQEDTPEDEKNEYAQILHKSANRLMELINNILDISKIEANQMEVVKSEFNLSACLLDLFDFFSLKAKNKNIELKVVLDSAYENLTIFSDEKMIHQIMMNLINNALKFTINGEVVFGVTVDDSSYHFYVEDTGIGISPDYLPNLFDRFSQEDPSNSRKYEGSGLGLPIVKGLANLLGGTINVSSSQGLGSRFTFILPVSEKDTKKTKLENENLNDKSNDLSNNSTKRRDCNMCKILIAEDDEISYKLLKNLLLREGKFDVLRAISGEEAVRLCEQNEDIAVVFMDLKMPLMDGLTATRLIRKFRTELPIIACTALAMLGDKEKALTAGCNDYIAKPYNPKDVVEKFHKYMHS